MMFATPCEEYIVSPTISRAMDRILTLHADHEQNASTSPSAWPDRPAQSIRLYRGIAAFGAPHMAAPTRPC